MNPKLSELLSKSSKTDLAMKLRLLLTVCVLGSLVISIFLYVDYQVQSGDAQVVPIVAAVADKSEKSMEIYVDISGAVVEPGIYLLPEKSRVNDLILKSGGIDKSADLAWVQKKLNLAEVLVDGQKIYIPFQGELDVVDPDNVSTSGDLRNNTAIQLIDLNLASQSDLEELPGVGSVTAGKIIEYREVNGEFGAIEEVMEVSGIGQVLFNEIKDRIKV